MVGASAGLRALAVPLMKIANDIRWLASGYISGQDFDRIVNPSAMVGQ